MNPLEPFRRLRQPLAKDHPIHAILTDLPAAARAGLASARPGVPPRLAGRARRASPADRAAARARRPHSLRRSRPRRGGALRVRRTLNPARLLASACGHWPRALANNLMG